MLPSLTVRSRRLDPRRIALAAASTLLAAGALTSAGSTTAATTPQRSLADELNPATWAIFVPSSWLAAPAPRVHAGDLLDLFGMRTGERAFAAPLTYGARVIAADDHGLLLEIDESDASAIAGARASGMQLLALLRSTR